MIQSVLLPVSGNKNRILTPQTLVRGGKTTTRKERQYLRMEEQKQETETDGRKNDEERKKGTEGG